MRLIILIHSLQAGGAERVTANLCNEFARRGWTVTLATLAGGEDFYPLDARVRRVALDAAGPSVGMLEAIAGNFKRLHSVRRLVRQVRPDVVLGMMIISGVLSIAASFGLGPRVVVSERNHPPMLREGRFWEWCRRLTYPFAHRVVVVAPETERWMRAALRRVHATVIPNAVSIPLPPVEPIVAPATVVPDDAQIVLAVGRLVPQKGFDVLIDAFAAVASRHPSWRLVIAGDGPMAEILRGQSARLGLADRILFSGRIGNLSDWYRRADLFVLSSRFEGFPNALIEAMGHGRAVVSFDCDTGPRDIVRHGVDGLLVRPVGDSSALGSSLDALMSDEPTRVRMGREAASVAERFSVDRIMSLWEKALRA
jgi:glycosyltransferase involved in cell wall biosynthesis